MKVLVTGNAGLIGSHIALKLRERGDEAISFDILNYHYDVSLKKARLASFIDHPNYTHADLADRAAVGVALAAFTSKSRRGSQTLSTGARAHINKLSRIAN